MARCLLMISYFNPRSLAGATRGAAGGQRMTKISIHAPSRERLRAGVQALLRDNFNPRSLAGATRAANRVFSGILISIHAPSRERQKLLAA